MLVSMKLLKQALIVFHVILIVLVTGACGNATAVTTVTATIPTFYPAPVPSATSKPLSKKFLFVEIWVKVIGTGIVGSTRVDKPLYFFDNPELYLYGVKSLTSNDLGYIGQGTSMHGSAGGGVASTLTTFQQFPYQTSLTVSTGKMNELYSAELVAIPVTFLSVSEDGVIVVEINTNEIMLTPGESWIWTVDTPIFSDKYDGTIQVISSVTNYGWLDIDSIHP